MHNTQKKKKVTVKQNKQKSEATRKVNFQDLPVMSQSLPEKLLSGEISITASSNNYFKLDTSRAQLKEEKCVQPLKIHTKQASPHE